MTMERPISFVPYEQWLNDNYPRPASSADRRARTASARARRRISAMLIALGGRIGGTPPGNLPELQPPGTGKPIET